MGVGESKEVILEEVSPNVIAAFRFAGMVIALGAAIGKQVSYMV